MEKMYKNCKVKLTISNISKERNYETGIQQGDNMAPLLFLFVMQAIMETLNLSNITKHEIQYFPKSNNPLPQHGRLLSQPTNSKGTPFNLDNQLYVNDGTFIFQNRE